MRISSLKEDGSLTVHGAVPIIKTFTHGEMGWCTIEWHALAGVTYQAMISIGEILVMMELDVRFFWEGGGNKYLKDIKRLEVISHN